MKGLFRGLGILLAISVVLSATPVLAIDKDLHVKEGDPYLDEVAGDIYHAAVPKASYRHTGRARKMIQGAEKNIQKQRWGAYKREVQYEWTADVINLGERSVKVAVEIELLDENGDLLSTSGTTSYSDDSRWDYLELSAGEGMTVEQEFWMEHGKAKRVADCNVNIHYGWGMRQ